MNLSNELLERKASQPDLKGFSEPVRRLWGRSSPCMLCPRNCKARRGEGQTGFCGIASLPKVSSVGPHFGEESVLVGIGGSGTIFFAGCNLGCVYCQNYDISHLRQGEDFTVDQLAQAMLELQNRRCSNINLVTPTHVVAPITAAIELAGRQGLNLPIVYNTGGYDSVETLKLLEGFIGIYMPDMKYSDCETAGELSGAADYPEINRKAIKEMHRQVGDLQIENGLATRGLLIRHLVLPNNLAGSFKTIDFLTDDVSTNTVINVMAQYRPCYHAGQYSRINRPPSPDEILAVRNYAGKKGLRVLTD